MTIDDKTKTVLCTPITFCLHSIEAVLGSYWATFFIYCFMAVTWPLHEEDCVENVAVRRLDTFEQILWFSKPATCRWKWLERLVMLDCYKSAHHFCRKSVKHEKAQKGLEIVEWKAILLTRDTSSQLLSLYLKALFPAFCLNIHSHICWMQPCNRVSTQKPWHVWPFV